VKEPETSYVYQAAGVAAKKSNKTVINDSAQL